VVEPESLMEEATALARKIMSKGPIAVRCALEAVNRGLQTTLDEGLRIEADMFARACSTEDKDEGTSAFLAKRKPEFKGR